MSEKELLMRVTVLRKVLMVFPFVPYRGCLNNNVQKGNGIYTYCILVVQTG